MRRILQNLAAQFRTPLAIFGLVFASAWIFVAIFADFIAPYNPIEQSLPRLTAPGEDSILGTDELGRDVFSRVIFGARVTIPNALMLVSVAMIIGTLLGAIAGFFGGIIDDLIMRLCDLVLAFPTIILAMVITASLGPSLMNAVIAGILVTWPAYARLVRGQVLILKNREFVLAGRMMGFRTGKTIRTDILPNVVGPIVVLASLEIGTAVLLLSGLSFLGLGTTPPTAEWGSMVSSAMNNFDKWWLGVFPGLGILTVVLAFNFLGDALRDGLDARTATVERRVES